MSSFEYLSVFVAVIMGLAVTRLLGAVGSCLRQRDSIQGHWVHSLWALNVLTLRRLALVGALRLESAVRMELLPSESCRAHAVLPTVFLLSMAVYIGWGILFLAG